VGASTLVLEVSLGNEAMTTLGEVLRAVGRSFDEAANAHGRPVSLTEPSPETDGIDYCIRDDNGNTVGGWTVKA
jgi:hypothetical protein